MAKIVLAMATTHGPQLHTTVEQWQLRVIADKARKHPFRDKELSFDELIALRRPEGLDKKSVLDKVGLNSTHPANVGTRWRPTFRPSRRLRSFRGLA